MVPQDRIELSTYPLPRGCATTTLLRRTIGREARGSVAIAHDSGERKVAERTAEAARKKDRLAAALRENLKRRKAQARAKEPVAGQPDKDSSAKDKPRE